MKSKNQKNENLVAKKQIFGSKLPLDRRPLEVPSLFLIDSHVVSTILETGKGYSGASCIEPLYAGEFLRRLPDSFQNRRLQAIFLQERERRLKSCKSDRMRRNLLSVFNDVVTAKLGSHDPSEDDLFVPTRKHPRLQNILEFPKRNELWEQKDDTRKGPNSEIIF